MEVPISGGFVLGNFFRRLSESDMRAGRYKSWSITNDLVAIVLEDQYGPMISFWQSVPGQMFCLTLSVDEFCQKFMVPPVEESHH